MAMECSAASHGHAAKQEQLLVATRPGRAAVPPHPAGNAHTCWRVVGQQLVLPVHPTLASAAAVAARVIAGPAGRPIALPVAVPLLALRRTVVLLRVLLRVRLLLASEVVRLALPVLAPIPFPLPRPLRDGPGARRVPRQAFPLRAERRGGGGAPLTACPSAPSPSRAHPGPCPARSPRCRSASRRRRQARRRPARRCARRRHREARRLSHCRRPASLGRP